MLVVLCLLVGAAEIYMNVRERKERKRDGKTLKGKSEDEKAEID